MNEAENVSSDKSLCAVPLAELLASVPGHLHAMVEITSTHHRNIPYGRYCQEAAVEMKRLQKQVTLDRDLFEAIHTALIAAGWFKDDLVQRVKQASKMP